MKTLGQKVKQVAALLGTADLNEWETGFVTNLDAITGNGQDTTRLTDNQITALERIYNRHFA
jgi:hypothetical protein